MKLSVVPQRPSVLRNREGGEKYKASHDRLSKTILQGTLKDGSAEDMLGGQHRKVDIPTHARIAYNGLPQKRLEEDLC